MALLIFMCAKHPKMAMGGISHQAWLRQLGLAISNKDWLAPLRLSACSLLPSACRLHFCPATQWLPSFAWRMAFRQSV
jgi:hypothetical protein